MSAIPSQQQEQHPALLCAGTRSSLSLVWIAATVGPKAHHLKRISKRDLLTLNVPAACRLIAQPNLNLRISSTLLSGVSRVYGQQYTLHYNNVINVLDQIRFHLASKPLAEITLEPKISQVQRAETITLPLYPDIDIFAAGGGDFPAFHPPGTPIAPAAFPEEHLPSGDVGEHPSFRAGTPSMELGRALAEGGTPLGAAGLTSDFSTSDFGGVAFTMGQIMLPESARALGQESPSFVASTRSSFTSTRRVTTTGRAPGIPTIAELAMAEEREHGYMDLDLGLDLPPLAVPGGEIHPPEMAFEHMSPLLQALPRLSPEVPPPLLIEEPMDAAEERVPEEDFDLEPLAPMSKRRRVLGPRHPRLDATTELPAAFWQHPPVVGAPTAARAPSPPPPSRDDVLSDVFGPLIPGLSGMFSLTCRVPLLGRQQARDHREAYVPPPPPPEQVPPFAERYMTPEPEARRAVSEEPYGPGDVSLEAFRPPYAFGVHDLTAEEAAPPRPPSGLESPSGLPGFLPPVSPIMAGFPSDISSLAGAEPQFLFPPSPQLQPMREVSEEPADISTAQYTSAMEQQSLNFLERTTVLLEASATGELTFDDLLPARNKTVAAQALYHLLTLATQNKLKVAQDAPYQTIYVRNVDEL